MPLIMEITTGQVPPTSRRRGAPRRLFRGQMRTLIRKSLAKMKAIANADFRAIARGAELGFVPATVSMSSVAADRNAFERVIARLQKCMVAKEGDE